MIIDLCVFCTHWKFNGGEPGYSEYTPGTDTRMDCGKGHWNDKNQKYFDITWLSSEEEFREKINLAKSCPDYNQVKP